MITIHVDEGVYRRFQRSAAERGESAAELIRQAMVAFDRSQLHDPTSIFDGEPRSVGEILRDLSLEDDVLEEMLE